MYQLVIYEHGRSFFSQFIHERLLVDRVMALVRQPKTELTDRQWDALNALRVGRYISTKVVAESMDVGYQGAYDRLNELRDMGLVENKKRIGWTPTKAGKHHLAQTA